MNYIVAALYRFLTVNDPVALRDQLKPAISELGICGTLLIAPEGINGTLAGSSEAIDKMLTLLHLKTGLPKSEVKFSTASIKPFKRLKIRLKREIITFQQPEADPNKISGTYVTAEDWNALISQSDVVVLDTRNSYETALGTFRGAFDPKIDRFSDFTGYVRHHLDPKKHKKIAMFCTGGIRCEKASSFMRLEGFEEVYHLQGGILKYLEVVPEDQSLWQGDCYVFDKRMAVGLGLTTGRYSMCFSCGAALNEEGTKHTLYEKGASCEHCHALTSESDKERFRMRQQQITEKNINNRKS